MSVRVPVWEHSMSSMLRGVCLSGVIGVIGVIGVSCVLPFRLLGAEPQLDSADELAEVVVTGTAIRVAG
jgi:hypothetical protein